jgi:ribosome-binding factor A
MPSRRVERVNELIRTELGDLVGRSMRDPRLSGLASITEVHTTPDLRHARVYVSILGTEDDKKSTMIALQAASGFLRRELASRMTMKYVPDLTFLVDESIERGERIRELLRQVNEPGPPPEDG